MAKSTQYGAFVPNTFLFDVQQLQSTEISTPEFKELLVRLYQNLNLMCNVLNIKDSGKYVTSEFINGQLFFPNPNNNSSTPGYPAERQVRRKVINYTTALPSTGTATIPHNIVCSPATTFTRIYATASDTSGFNYVPIPYASASGTTNIEIKLDGTNVYIITASNRSNFNQTYVVLEYLQT